MCAPSTYRSSATDNSATSYDSAAAINSPSAAIFIVWVTITTTTAYNRSPSNDCSTSINRTPSVNGGASVN